MNGLINILPNRHTLHIDKTVFQNEFVLEKFQREATLEINLHMQKNNMNEWHLRMNGSLVKPESQLFRRRSFFIGLCTVGPYCRSL